MTNGTEHCHKNGFHTNGVENGLSEVDGEVHVCLLSLSCIILLNVDFFHFFNCNCFIFKTPSSKGILNGFPCRIALSGIRETS